MGRHWTEEERQRQSEIIRKHKPWEKSTGPRTWQGKSRSSQNRLSHGDRCGVMRTQKQLMRSFLSTIIDEGELWYLMRERHPKALTWLLEENPDMLKRLARNEKDWQENGYLKLLD